MKSNFSYHKTEKGSLKLWDKGLTFESEAMAQLHNVANLPFIHKHVAGMPDVHKGFGATVGSVIATKGAVVPAAVGVDIGCGMMATRLDLKAEHLPDDLSGLRSLIEAVVPHGRTDNGGRNDKGRHNILPDHVGQFWQRELAGRYDKILDKHPKAMSKNNVGHLGTLGTGNHFIEVCIDEEDYVWVMLHSGSRGLGNTIGRYFIYAAKMEMERYHILDYLPDTDLSYLVENTEIFDDYIEAVGFAQDFALANRVIMMEQSMKALACFMGRDLTQMDGAVNCHHNYIQKENHFNTNVYVTRKGAVKARLGDLGIIPGSMGAKSYIVEGKGNCDSFHSCSHGAGRTMSRNQANKMFTVEDLKKQTAGIECRKDKDVVDEIPGAYKDIDKVMEAQSDLVKVVHTLRQVVNVKG